MEKRKILFAINQLFKGGAETALINLLRTLSPDDYEVDLLVFDQVVAPNAISLVPEVPEWVHVVDCAEKERIVGYGKKAWFKICRIITGKQQFRASALRYVRKREYDVAFSFGEWFSSALVGEKVRAKRKYVWIHADIDKASFLHPDIMHCEKLFDGFIFVSEQSRQAALRRFPSLRERTAVIPNLVNQEGVRKKGQEESAVSIPRDMPILLTVANIRPEKNHLRQVEVMRRLKERGFRFRWLNAGSCANVEEVGKVKKAVHDAGLEEDFLLLGAVKNPYPLMKAARAVCVLSDHESWSMVIAEAKTLGTPVIATSTSGAKEQIISGESGILCDFSVEDIVEKIAVFLHDDELEKRIRAKLSHFSGTDETLQRLKLLMENKRQKILYVFDDINYTSGARNAALQQIAHLSETAEVILFSAEPCRDESINARYRVVDLSEDRAFRSLSVPTRDVLADRTTGKRVKCLRILYAVLVRLHMEQHVYKLLFNDEIRAFMESFDSVCVVSEASKFRDLAATLDHPRKIQWIHTDYAAWRELSAWTRAITRRDAAIYQNYDHIVCLSERLKRRFVELYPCLNEKVEVIPNFIDYERILCLAETDTSFVVDKTVFNLITVGRLEWEKRHDRLLRIAAGLKEQGFLFHWYFVGGGSLAGEARKLCDLLKLNEQVTFTGALENPYPLMKQCDLFVLLSEYEGTPVTIDEAKVLGLPVLANDIGGIADQLEGGRYGRVVAVDSAKDEIILESEKKQKTEREDNLLAAQSRIANHGSYLTLLATFGLL